MPRELIGIIRLPKVDQDEIRILGLDGRVYKTTQPELYDCPTDTIVRIGQALDQGIALSVEVVEGVPTTCPDESTCKVLLLSHERYAIAVQMGWWYGQFGCLDGEGIPITDQSAVKLWAEKLEHEQQPAAGQA